MSKKTPSPASRLQRNQTPSPAVKAYLVNVGWFLRNQPLKLSNAILKCRIFLLEVKVLFRVIHHRSMIVALLLPPNEKAEARREGEP